MPIFPEKTSNANWGPEWFASLDVVGVTPPMSARVFEIEQQGSSIQWHSICRNGVQIMVGPSLIQKL